MTAEQRDELAELMAELARQQELYEEAKSQLDLTDADIDCAWVPDDVVAALDADLDVDPAVSRPTSSPPILLPHAVRV